MRDRLWLGAGKAAASAAVRAAAWFAICLGAGCGTDDPLAAADGSASAEVIDAAGADGRLADAVVVAPIEVGADVAAPADAAPADAAPADAPATPTDAGGGCTNYVCPSVPPASAGAAVDTGALMRWQRWPAAVTTAGLRDVWAASDGEAWAVGEHGAALHFTAGAWKAVPTGVDVQLNAVAGSGPDDVWAGGEGPTLLHFDGNKWQTVAAPSQKAILDFAVVARDEVYLLAQDRNRAFRFDGATWTAMPEPGLGYGVTALWSPGPGRLWMASFARVFTWNGKLWADEELPGNAMFTGIHGSSPDDVWLVEDKGYGGLPMLAHLDGERWSTTRERIAAVWSRHAHEAWGAGGGNLWHWDGTTWWSRAVPQPLRALGGVPEGRVWAVGDAGAIWSFEPAPAERCARATCVPAAPDPTAPRNPCGGTRALAGAPGGVCRPCGARWACAEVDRLVCHGGIAINSCGGCRVMHQPEGNPYHESPGSSCGAGHVYACSDEDYLTCGTSAGVNTCGGTGPLAHPIGERCGATPDCRYACSAGTGTTVCLCDKHDGGA